MIGQVTFSVSYVVVIVRSRLAAIGPDYEQAARDLGASPRQALQHVLLPLLTPAILASMLIVFALSIDDFVVTQYMSSSGDTTTIPMLLYSNARGGATTPALNAVATIMVVTTLIGVGGAYLAPALVRLAHRVGLARLGDARADGGGKLMATREEEAIAVGANGGERGGAVALRGADQELRRTSPRSTRSTSRSPPASSSRCSARRAAARRRRCG